MDSAGSRGIIEVVLISRVTVFQYNYTRDIAMITLYHLFKFFDFFIIHVVEGLKCFLGEASGEEERAATACGERTEMSPRRARAAFRT